MTKFESILQSALAQLLAEGWRDEVTDEKLDPEAGDEIVNDACIPEGSSFVRHIVSLPSPGADKHSPKYGPDIDLFLEHDCYRITTMMDWGQDNLAEGSLSDPALSGEELIALIRKAERDSREAGG